MKKTLKITLGILLAGMVFWANAQPGQRQAPPSPDEILERATKTLQLTEDQISAWEEIHEKYAEQIEEDPRKAGPKIATEIEGILTEEQWEQFQKMMPKPGGRRSRDD